MTDDEKRQLFMSEEFEQRVSTLLERDRVKREGEMLHKWIDRIPWVAAGFILGLLFAVLLHH